MADKDIRIGIVTTADTAGVEKTTAAFTGMVDKVKVSEIGYYDLGEEIRKTDRRHGELAESVKGVERPTRNTGLAMLEFSRALEDSQYGIRGVVNNIPGLVLSLGATGGVAAAASIAAVGVSLLVDWLGKTSEAATVTEERLKQVGDTSAKLETAKLKEVRDELKLAEEEAKLLKQNFEETTKAGEAYKTAALDNSEKIKTAEITVNRLLGERINKLNELAEKEAAAAAKRKQEAENALAAEQRRLKAAEDAVAEAETRKNNLNTVISDTQTRLDEKLAKLNNMRAEFARLEEVANQKTTITTSVGGARQFGLEQQAADAKLALGPLSEAIARLDAQVTAIQRQKTEDEKALRRTEVNLKAALNKQEDIAEAVRINSERVVENFQASAIQQEAAGASEKAKTIAETLLSTFGEIQTNNARGLEAKANISKAVEDGALTQKEIAETSRSMITLIGLLQSGQATTKDNVGTLMTNQKQLNAAMDSLRQELDGLKGAIEQNLLGK